MKKHLLVKIAEKNHAQAKGSIESFTNNQKADDLITDLDNYPHAYVLACLMDRQITAERAWIIPYQIFKEIGYIKGIFLFLKTYTAFCIKCMQPIA